MTEYKTNFALVCDLLGVTGPELTEATGAGRAYVSLWRSGGRRLVKEHKWNVLLADFLLSRDAARRQPLIPALMEQTYGAAAQGDGLREQLMGWLDHPDQNTPEQVERRTALYAAMLTQPHQTAPTAPPANENRLGGARVTYGMAAAQQTILHLVEYMQTFEEPSEFTFVCPDGIDLITRDIDYAMEIARALRGAGERGHRFNAILRTDFKMSEVSAFAGPWLVAHLAGFVRSWYYDDLRLIETDRMFAAVPGKFAFRITGNDYRCEAILDAAEIERIHKECGRYLKQSQVRFHYELFEKPEGYLSDLKVREGDYYLFQRLPHFAIGGEGFLTRMGLSQKECDYVLEQFQCLYTSPDLLGPDTHVCHMLCTDSLDEALDKPKHLCYTLQDMLGRRVYMNTQTLVDQLCEVRRLMKARKNYSICFLSADVFEKMIMELCVCGWAAAVGWIQSRCSTATTSHTTTATLHGFSQVVWGQIPKIAKSRPAASRSLNKLLNRAQKMGYTVR